MQNDLFIQDEIKLIRGYKNFKLFEGDNDVVLQFKIYEETNIGSSDIHIIKESVNIDSLLNNINILLMSVLPYINCKANNQDGKRIVLSTSLNDVEIVEIYIDAIINVNELKNCINDLIERYFIVYSNKLDRIIDLCNSYYFMSFNFGFYKLINPFRNVSVSFSFHPFKRYRFDVLISISNNMRVTANCTPL